MPTALATPGDDAPVRRAPSSSIGRLASSDSVELGGFAPGAMLAGRYRIVGLLGRGGMGEVYRADDLKLGQPVALKFLPEALAQDAGWRERFYAEVRNARQVSHPNVCRVYDVGELDGQHYLSMEYVDGEDLASLLKRIGRLPQDKALEIARQLCAGLAAAHDKLVLHRDLKPANVMIDGRGRARITDFGLAVRADEARSVGDVGGTPAYMAPEQLAGSAATVQSDLYALGLVLYELHTGRPAFRAATLTEMVRKQREEIPASPSSIVREIDHAVEQAILKCLEKDPRSRPSSALAVAAALPGGDPLRAALAAGETPSPEMVAAAGERGALSPAVAWACLASMLLGLLLVTHLAGQTMLFRQVPLEKPPDALADRAKEIVKKLGYVARPADSVYGFTTNRSYLRYVAEHDKSPERWKRLAANQPPAVLFWYRQSPRTLVPKNREWGMVEYDDPPTNISGMANVWLDTEGRLVGFRAVPPRFDASKGSWPVPDWSLLFSEAGLDLATFSPAEPAWMPPVGFDIRAAWEGVYAPRPDIRLRVEAAAFHGKPVYFVVLEPWDLSPGTETSEGSAGGGALSLWSILATAILVGSIALARRNIRLGRGDRRGALKVALYFSSAQMLSWLFAADHAPDFDQEAALFATALGRALVSMVFVWLLYMALEPLVRRRWPDTLISWNRLLTGRFRDPLVGRDILIGGLFGVAVILVSQVGHLAPSWLGMPQKPPSAEDLSDGLGQGHRFVGIFFDRLRGSLGLAMAALFLLLLLRLLLRKQWLAVGVWVVLLAVLFREEGQSLLGLLFSGLIAVLLILVLIRFGLLSLTVAFFVASVFFYSPITLDFSAWYAGRSLFALLFFATLAAYGFHTALAGRPAFGGAILKD